MKRLPINYRTLIIMLLVTGMYFMNVDAFGQVCYDCGITAAAGCATISSTDTCQFAAAGGTTSAPYATAFGNADASGVGSFAASQGNAEGEYATGLSDGVGLADYAVGIGERSSATASKAIAIGQSTLANGVFSMSLGFNNYADAPNSIALGALTKTNSARTYNYVFGKGLSNLNRLENDVSNSIMFGMNSDVSTVFIGNSGGTTGSYGNVGIGDITDDAASLLHVRDQLRVGYASEDNGSIVFNNGTNTNTITFNSGETTTTHEYTLPLEQGDNGDVLTNNGSGVLSWAAPGTASDSWLIDGNGGTTAGTNFLGTTDNVDLVFKTFGDEEMRIKANGNVGIGTTTPISLLHLETGSGSNTVLTLAAASDQSRMVEFRENGAVSGWLRQFGGDDRIEFRNSMSGRDIRFNVNVGTVGGTGTPTNALTIDGDNGFVGIGANFNTPSFRLDVRAEDIDEASEVIARFRVEDDDDSFVRIENRSSTDNEYAPWIQGSSATTAFAALELTARVQDAGNSGTVPAMIFSTLREDFEEPVSRPLFSWKSNVTRMQMDAAGNLGIGTTAPSGRLEVAGTAYINTLPVAAGTIIGYDATNRLVDVSGSSLHFKEQIEDLQFNHEQFLSMRPVSFKWKPACGGSQDVGFIAQEVAEDFPPLADIRYKHTYLPDGLVLRDTLGLPVLDSTQTEPYGVKYFKLPIYLYMLAKQQDSTITELTNRVGELQALVESCCAQPAYRMSDEVPTESQNPLKTELNEFVLLQNDPNPFSDYTDIRVSVPESAKNVSLLIVDMKGSVMLNTSISGTSETIRVYSSDIGKGVFTYYLLSEGNVIASRKMVSSK